MAHQRNRIYHKRSKFLQQQYRVTKETNKLLDYIDVIVLDYLVQNPDRHILDYIDAPTCAILLIDNTNRTI